MKPSLLPGLALVLLLAGCARMRFSDFTGDRDWPLSPGAMADHAYAIPVYQGWPERPYEVLGSIRFADPSADWDDGDTKRAARMAKHRDADAIIIRRGGEFGVEGYTGAAADSKIVTTSQRTVLAIKWKSAEQLDRERETLRRMRSDFIARHPGLAPDAQLFELATRCARQTAGQGDVETLLVQVLAREGESPETTWLFRGTLRTASFASTYTQVVYGVATLRQPGGAVAIVSVPGSVQINFAGTLTDGRLSGQLGVTTGSTIFSGKADGVFLEDRISLTGNALTADGTVQSSFILSR